MTDRKAIQAEARRKGWKITSTVALDHLTKDGHENVDVAYGVGDVALVAGTPGKAFEEALEGTLKALARRAGRR